MISLSQREAGEFRPYLQRQGIEAHCYIVPGEGSALYFIRHLNYFIKFCREQNVDYVFSHLDTPNFIASLGQYLIKARVFLCRHHVNEAELYNYNLSWTYRLTNLLAKKIIVVSSRSLEYMTRVEKVPPKKLIHINLAYDFSLYDIPSEKDTETIRSKFKTELLLLTVCRLTKFKRPELSIQVVEKLKSQGIIANLIILGNGPIQQDLKDYVLKNKLENQIFILGHLSDVMKYIAAADLIIHPSVLESSCVVIKEAALVNKPVVVCKGVGDFDDYMQNESNGFLVEQDDFVNSVIRIIHESRNEREKFYKIGNKLREDVCRLFDIRNVAKMYDFIKTKN